jgi:4-diphosphocytidyl-2-C-methyl-D-erythritol kinase
MHLFNEVCNLGIDTPTLAKLGSKIGADIPFFIYNYTSANVYGFGEIVERFEEESLDMEIYTPNIHCSTPLVYKTFKMHLLDKLDIELFRGWDSIGSRELLSQVSPIEANDLFRASLIAYPELRDEVQDGWYFSGSGSSFFRIK